MKNKLLWYALAAYAAWLLLKKKKTGPVAPSAQTAASTARQMVSDIVDQTTFLPDTTTDADLYAKDKSQCL